ncbi:MAG: hypothetical protein VX729_15020 [Pseudomonadota bacterium]|nr:hypothetical protein [Pseudomonadota bacterium]
MNVEFKMMLLSQVKQIVADTYLAYDLAYTGSEAFDSYLREGELGIATEALRRCKLGPDTVKEEMVDLFNEIMRLIESDRKQRFLE